MTSVHKFHPSEAAFPVAKCTPTADVTHNLVRIIACLHRAQDVLTAHFVASAVPCRSTIICHRAITVSGIFVSSVSQHEAAASW